MAVVLRQIKSSRRSDNPPAEIRNPKHFVTGHKFGGHCLCPIPLLPISANPASNSDSSIGSAALEPLNDLVKSARDGDDAAASALIERLYPLVLKIIRTRLSKRTGEEDLCQMIFVRIFRHLDQYSGLAPLEHWVSRLAVNVCLNQIERERIRPELRYADLDEEQVRVVEQLASTPAEIPAEHSASARELVAKLLHRLDPKDRLIITMLHLEERSIAEIQALTGWNAILIKVRAYRARQKMKRMYGQIVSQCR